MCGLIPRLCCVWCLCVCVCVCVCVCDYSSPSASGDMKVPPVIQSCPPCISMIQQPLFDMLRCLFGRCVRTCDSTLTLCMCMCEQVECNEAYFYSVLYCTLLYITSFYSTLLYCIIVTSHTHICFYLSSPSEERNSVTYGLAVELWLLYLQPWKTSHLSKGTYVPSSVTDTYSIPLIQFFTLLFLNDRKFCSTKGSA